MKLVRKLLIYAFAAIPIILLINIFINILILEKETNTANGIEYTNKKIDYSVSFSTDWKRTNKLVSLIIFQLERVQFKNSSKNLSLEIRWNQFYERDNKNLLKFANDDAKYAEQNQDSKTIKIETVSQDNKEWIIRYIGESPNTHFIQYYIFYKSDPENNLIHILYFYSNSTFTQPQINETLTVVKNFKQI